MKRIVVTGGAGRLGRVTIAELIEHGYEVLAVDRVRGDVGSCPFVVADLTDAAAVYDVLRGADAVIHLGAIPGPQSHAASVTFQNNVMSTYHVVEAAATLGFFKVVFASSVFPLGWVLESDRYWPEYVPVDESHPLTPFEGYGLSKLVGEEVCASSSRRTGLVSVSLRIMNVIQPDGYDALPWPIPTAENGVRFVMWPYVDVRDAARACRLALEADSAGHETFYIAAADIRFDHSTRSLLQQFAPQAEIRGPLQGNASVISIEKAQRLLGYQPQFTWQTQSSNRDRQQ